MRSLTLLLLLAAGVPSPAQPPATDIWTGQPLDAWVERLADKAAPAGTDPEPPLDRKLLEAISLAWAGTTGNGARSLRSPEKLAWPEALKDVPAKTGRDRWVELVRRATKEARKGRPSGEVMRDLAAVHKLLLDNLEEQADDLTPTQYIEGRRFLIHLKADLGLLKESRVGELLALADNVAARRRTVPELVKLFREKKLRFARCVPGDEKAYLALEQALADFARRAGHKGSSSASRKQSGR